jgi:cell division protein FtsZ
MTIEMIEVEEFNQGTQIKVIGVGGGGGNAVEHMIAAQRAGRGVHLRQHRCAGTVPQFGPPTIQLGASGLGAGSKPERAATRPRLAIDDIRAAIEGAHMLFITAGMGGGTGTGLRPVIAAWPRKWAS